MAQATILASGTTAATSSDVVIAAGSVKTVGMFAASGAIPGAISVTVMIDTPGADAVIGYLTPDKPAMVVAGPGTFRVVRALVPTAVGVFTEG